MTALLKWIRLGAKRCMFCGRSDSKITKEHAWPNWIRELLPAGHSTIKSGRPEGTARSWVRFNDMGVTVKAVCECCNNGWMASLEDRARPVLTPMHVQAGEHTTLLEANQLLIATWAYKTAMVFEFARPSSHPKFYSAEDRKILADSGQIPNKRVLVFLSTYDGPLMSTAYSQWLTYEATGDNALGFKGHCTTISVGRVAVQIWAVKPPTGIRGGYFPAPRGRWDGRCERIWPASGAVSWPLSTTLDNDGLSDLAQRWDLAGPIKHGFPYR